MYDPPNETQVGQKYVTASKAVLNEHFSDIWSVLDEEKIDRVSLYRRARSSDRIPRKTQTESEFASGFYDQPKDVKNKSSNNQKVEQSIKEAISDVQDYSYETRSRGRTSTSRNSSGNSSKPKLGLTRSKSEHRLKSRHYSQPKEDYDSSFMENNWNDDLTYPEKQSNKQTYTSTFGKMDDLLSLVTGIAKHGVDHKPSLIKNTFAEEATNSPVYSGISSPLPQRKFSGTSSVGSSLGSFGPGPQWSPSTGSFSRKPINRSYEPSPLAQKSNQNLRQSLPTPSAQISSKSLNSTSWPNSTPMTTSMPSMGGDIYSFSSVANDFFDKTRPMVAAMVSSRSRNDSGRSRHSSGGQRDNTG